MYGNDDDNTGTSGIERMVRAVDVGLRENVPRFFFEYFDDFGGCPSEVAFEVSGTQTSHGVGKRPLH